MPKLPISVAFCSDMKYVAHLATAIQSLFEYSTKDVLDVYIISTDLDVKSKEKLKIISENFSQRIIFIDIIEREYSHLPVFGHFSLAIYLRLSLPDVMSLPKIIYLDCDVLIETSLRELWEIDISNYACAGMPEKHDIDFLAKLGLDGDTYINSGILLLNLKYWRENYVSIKCFEWLENNRLSGTPDQDAINIVLKNKKLSIDEHWNWNPVASGNVNNTEMYTERIFHFAGPLKPWHLYYHFALTKRYIEYRSRSSWSQDFSPAEPTNTVQSIVVADQFFNEGMYVEAYKYYKNAYDISAKHFKSSFETVVFEKIDKFKEYDKCADACDLFRVFFYNLGYTVGYTIGPYGYTNLLINEKKLVPIVQDYLICSDIFPYEGVITGTSFALKSIVHYIFTDKSGAKTLLDIGFGRGELGIIVKNNPSTYHWNIDGIDGFIRTCSNVELFEKKIYRNVWHGLAQNLTSAQLASYDLLCLFDVIEHLKIQDAKDLLRLLLTSLGVRSRLVISTPLWFMPQGHDIDGDLELHEFGVPASSMFDLHPIMYHVEPDFLVGTFVYEKSSSEYIENFKPRNDSAFDFSAGLENLINSGYRADRILYLK